VKDQDARLDEALAGGTLGGPHYDEIFERVLARSAPKEVAARRRTRWWLLAAALVPAAVGLVLIRPKVAPLTPKGPAGAYGVIEIGCGTSGRHVCHPGDTLMFSVNAAVVSGYLGAYAERVGDPVPQRIWYFPDPTGGTPVVAAGPKTIVLPEGIRIGAEHTPGRYRVTAWVAERPPTRAGAGDIPGSGALARDAFEIEVTP